MNAPAAPPAEPAHVRFGTWIAGAIAIVVLAFVSRLHATPYDNYALLADAFAHGRVAIDSPGPWIDALRYRGAFYVIEAPLPALLMLPQVVLGGPGANQTLLAIVLGGVATGATFELARRLGAPPAARAWLAAFFFLGTDVAWCASYGDVWFVAHLAAAAFTLLALVELFGARRPWLVALLGACAAESRFSLVLALPIYAWMLASEAPPERRPRTLGAFALALVPFVCLYVAYDYARWGVPNDVGYVTWYRQDAAGTPTGSPFDVAYLGYELHAFFVRFPDRLPRYPWLVPTYDGIALTWSSPALALAFFARAPRVRIAQLWCAAALVAVPSLVYYVDGYAQFGMRHALDFEPFLVALMALAVRRGMPRIGAALCVVSIAIGLWGIWYWRVFYRPL